MSKSVDVDNNIDASKLKTRNDFENKLKELNTEYVKFCEIVRENNEKRKEILNTMVKINDLFKQTIEDQDTKDSEEDLDEKLMSKQKKVTKKVKKTKKKEEIEEEESLKEEKKKEKKEDKEDKKEDKPKDIKKKPAKKPKTKKKKKNL